MHFCFFFFNFKYHYGIEEWLYVYEIKDFKIEFDFMCFSFSLVQWIFSKKIITFQENVLGKDNIVPLYEVSAELKWKHFKNDIDNICIFFK